MWRVDVCHVCAGHGLGLMSIGITGGKKMTILKHCVECVCTLQRWIYIDRSARRTPATSSKAATSRWFPHDPDRGAQRREVRSSRQGPDGLWFHIPEKFPLSDQICRKTLFFRVPYLWPAYESRETFCDAYSFHSLVGIPQMCPTRVTFAEVRTVFQLSMSEGFSLPRYQQWQNLDAYIFSNTRQWSPHLIANLHWYTTSVHIF